MVKEMMMKAMLNKQLAHIPQEQREKIVQAMIKNPELITTIARSVQEKIQSGKSQMDAAQEVMREHGEALRALLK